MSGNTAATYGGGMGVYYAALDAENSTISGNASIYGGGVWLGKNSSATLVNSTVTSNTAGQGGGVSDYGSFFSTSFEVDNSVVGYNPGGDCDTDAPTSTNSFDSDGSCGLSGTVHGLDPALADNGGPTHTHALIASASP